MGWGGRGRARSAVRRRFGGVDCGPDAWARGVGSACMDAAWPCMTSPQPSCVKLPVCATASSALHRQGAAGRPRPLHHRVVQQSQACLSSPRLLHCSGPPISQVARTWRKQAPAAVAAAASRLVATPAAAGGAAAPVAVQAAAVATPATQPASDAGADGPVWAHAGAAQAEEAAAGEAAAAARASGREQQREQQPEGLLTRRQEGQAERQPQQHACHTARQSQQECQQQQGQQQQQSDKKARPSSWQRRRAAKLRQAQQAQQAEETAAGPSPCAMDEDGLTPSDGELPSTEEVEVGPSSGEGEAAPATVPAPAVQHEAARPAPLLSAASDAAPHAGLPAQDRDAAAAPGNAADGVLHAALDPGVTHGGKGRSRGGGGGGGSGWPARMPRPADMPLQRSPIFYCSSFPQKPGLTSQRKACQYPPHPHPHPHPTPPPRPLPPAPGGALVAAKLSWEVELLGIRFVCSGCAHVLAGLPATETSPTGWPCRHPEQAAGRTRRRALPVCRYFRPAAQPRCCRLALCVRVCGCVGGCGCGWVGGCSTKHATGEPFAGTGAGERCCWCHCESCRLLLLCPHLQWGAPGLRAPTCSQSCRRRRAACLQSTGTCCPCCVRWLVRRPHWHEACAAVGQPHQGSVVPAPLPALSRRLPS